ncbi:hypothetical protein RsoM2USA_172 [Ralstonia phage RsoM2USA]|nr:hypothetical protein RsoM2USA_172 [Ralstonia phage RsoM2USA]
MFLVYWSVCQNELRIPQSKEFEHDQMKAALTFMEELRTQQRAGGPIGFVVMASENPNSVGNPGAADVLPGYDWKKRRD